MQRRQPTVREAGPERRRYELPDSIREEFDSIWLTDVTPLTEFSDYASLETELRRLADC